MGLDVREQRHRTSDQAARSSVTNHSDADVELALLDEHGVIVWVNRAWTDYCRDNDGDPALCGVGAAYLALCETTPEEPIAAAVASAIRRALAGALAAPEILLMPCDSPEQIRWFDLLVSSRFAADGRVVGATVVLLPSSAADAEPTRLLRLSHERDRLIADLHAAPLQDLFAVVVGLSTVLDMPAIASSPDLRDSLKAHIEAIDTAIGRIRQATTQLAPTEFTDMQTTQPCIRRRLRGGQGSP